MLKRLRRRRLRNRLSLLVIVALLWSQMVLAWHADCFSMSMPRMVAAAAAVHDHCARQNEHADRAACEAHCSQGDSSPATPLAVLSVPALPPVSFALITVVLQLGGGVLDVAPARAAAAWHRPTHHPASLLLI
jgi:hypothetical protein